MNIPPLTRATVALSLVISAALITTSVLTMPDFTGGHLERLQAIATAPRTAALSSLTFTFGQLFLAVGLVGLAHLLRLRVPVLATVGGVLALLGAFGHTVYGGVQMIMLGMAQDLAMVESYAEVLADVESGVGVVFLAMGLLATVLGFLVLGVAVWRAQLGPRWLGPAVIVWVPLEFVGSDVSQWAGYASGLLYAVLFITLALVVWRSSVAHWQTAAEVAQPAPERIPA